MAVLDGTGRVSHVNAALTELLGHDEDALLGATLDELTVADNSGLPGFETQGQWLRHERGHDVWAVVSVVDLPDEGYRLVCVDDASARRDTEQVLLHAALHDSLTNLPNRRLLRDRLETALARAQRSSTTVAVLFVDLDGFKEVNDTFGHDVGDEVLVGVAGAIDDALRSSDTVARLGGDEFVIVCEDVTDQEDVTYLADRVLEGIARPVQVHGRQVSVTASIGIAMTEGGRESGDELLRAADLAMYAAKHRTGTTYVLADESSPRRDRRVEPGGLLADLRHAIQTDALRLHYQPVVRVDGVLLGLEALVRWPHPRLGLLGPRDFLPRLRGTDLARPLTDWVLRTAVRDAASWRDPQVRVSVNVWASEAARPGFADTVAMVTAWAGLPARGLYLELPEAELTGSAAGPGLADELTQLRAIGVGLAVDDVGSQPLAALRQLPVDTLKVGRSFIAGCVDDPDDKAVVAAVVAVARASGRHPFAVGVETPAQRRLVTELGYVGLQGPLSGAPVPLDQLRDVVSSRRVPLLPS